MTIDLPCALDPTFGLDLDAWRADVRRRVLVRVSLVASPVGILLFALHAPAAELLATTAWGVALVAAMTGVERSLARWGFGLDDERAPLPAVLAWLALLASAAGLLLLAACSLISMGGGPEGGLERLAHASEHLDASLRTLVPLAAGLTAASLARLRGVSGLASCLVTLPLGGLHQPIMAVTIGLPLWLVYVAADGHTRRRRSVARPRAAVVCAGANGRETPGRRSCLASSGPGVALD